MTFDEFQKSLDTAKPPASVTGYLESLWYDEKGDWQKAHQIIQDIDDDTAAWIHAYLHRKEGDIGNADYWYNRAGRKRPAGTLNAEWKTIVQQLLSE